MQDRKIPGFKQIEWIFSEKEYTGIQTKIINIPGKTRRVGGKKGFKSGYKKAIIKTFKIKP